MNDDIAPVDFGGSVDGYALRKFSKSPNLSIGRLIRSEVNISFCKLRQRSEFPRPFVCR